VVSLMLTVTKGPISVCYCKSDIRVFFQNGICPAGQCSHSDSCDVAGLEQLGSYMAVVVAVK
jgi:hypothetical protein